MKQLVNHLTCLNCGSVVHWTTFQCHVCGRNPREKEPLVQTNTSRRDRLSQLTERRKHPRYDFQGRVILNRFFRGELVDLSQTGARLKTALQLFCDQVIHLHFTINGIPIQIRARVIHVKRGVLDDRFTLGVCFEAIGSDHNEVLNHHLHTMSGEKPRPQYLV